MCVATPLKVLEIKDGKAKVSSENHTHEVDISLIKGLSVGDYILAHFDMGIKRVPEEEALEMLELIASNHHSEGDGK
jgi:hydrogenase assembly chaperone HypC/HupF